MRYEESLAQLKEILSKEFTFRNATDDELAYGHDHALLGNGQGLINVCYEQDNGNRMAVR